MQLLHHRTLLRSYSIDLGFAPVGHKVQEGDGRTPEGGYRIDRRNPNSSFHLSLGISYPDASDVAYARAKGVAPGGDIFIHGHSSPFNRRRHDWTRGCVDVPKRQMEEIYAMVRNGTPIQINA